MTDAELIARLREHREYCEESAGIISFEVDVCIEAADRIEELLNLNEVLVELMDDRDAKLVADLDGIKQSICAILAEIKGKNHD